MADECVYKISSRYPEKLLSYDITHVENNQICPFSPFFLPILDFSRVFLGYFSCSLRKVDLKACIAVPYHDFFRGLTFLPDDLRWPWPVLCSSWMLKTAWDGHREPTYQISTHSYNGAERNRNIYTNSLMAYTISQCVVVLRLRIFLKMKRVRHSFLHVQWWCYDAHLVLISSILEQAKMLKTYFSILTFKGQRSFWGHKLFMAYLPMVKQFWTFWRLLQPSKCFITEDMTV